MNAAPRQLRACLAVVAAVFGVLLAGSPAEAALAPAPCAGNVCTGSIVVGGQNVQYSYTQHIRPNGTLRIRLNGGVYNTTQLIQYTVHDLPPFASFGKFKNPAAGNVFLPEEYVGPGNQTYRRSDSDGCAGCIADQVMTMTYSGLAAGVYSFSLTIVQNVATGTVTGKTFYVDAAAPDTADESSSIAFGGAHPEFEPACGDGVDNDLSYKKDCADPLCVGKPASAITPSILCEDPEQSCADGFDNDADGFRDCQDPSCDGRTGRADPLAYCQVNESGASLFGTAPCADTFDNDGDGRTDCVDNLSVPSGDATKTCWKQAGYGCPATETDCSDGTDNDKDKSYDDSWDDVPTTGKDCTDYDCAGNAACPSFENQTAAGLEAEQQCFNLADDDLDHLFDCADPDCRGVVNPADPTKVCYEREFDLGQRYQYCANAFDDDGDGPKDCADSDCAGKFLDCGPCPSREDYTISSCADTTDNDGDAAQNCADADCAGDLGKTDGAAWCAAPGGETGQPMCSDRFDNDADGVLDCADPNCGGTSVCAVPGCGRTYACQPGTEAACTDREDNDRDGRRDCADTDCSGGSCPDRTTWTESSCRTVPLFSGEKAFAGGGATVTVQAYLSTHTNGTDVVRMVGVGSYDTVVFIIGDNTAAAEYYPYANTGGCALNGTGAAQFSVSVSAAPNDHAVLIENIIQPVVPFDMTLTCATPAAPAASATYPMRLSALTSGGTPEFGIVEFDTVLYDGTEPVVLSVVGEGEYAAPAATVDVAFGESARFAAYPAEPEVGAFKTGICSCVFDVGGAAASSVGGSCVSVPVAFTEDRSVTVSATAEDGANNVGDPGGARAIAVNVRPSVTNDLVMSSPPKPFFKTGSDSFYLTAEFRTGTTDQFLAPNCGVYVSPAAGGSPMNGPVGPSAQFPGVTVGNQISCAGQVTIDPGWMTAMEATEFVVTVRVTDGDGDVAETRRLPVFVCNGSPAFGQPYTVCSRADFDYDGASDGMYTTLYSTTHKACDNCLNLSNPVQKDDNANGVGNDCETNNPSLGRCEIDMDVVCGCDADPNVPPAPCADGPRCPSPSIGTDGGGAHVPDQKCVKTWGLCSVGGGVCLDFGTGTADQQCKFCDDDPSVGCRTAADCDDAGVGGACGTLPGTSGDGLCGDGVTLCRRDSDCDSAGVATPCTGANLCENLLFPWLQTLYGNIYSRKKIIAPDAPPQGQYNATYCISAGDTVRFFKSEHCIAATDVGLSYRAPKAPTYSSSLGRIDIDGLLANKYGETVELNDNLANLVLPLAGKVYVRHGDLTINAPLTVTSAPGATEKGNGTIIVIGGNLTINADIAYGTESITRLNQLASIGWIVLPDGGGAKGNIYIDKGVNVISGAFFSGGSDGIFTVAPPETEGASPLTVYGLMVGKQFHLLRSFKSLTQGSERIIFDGRSVANPPPGLGDATRALPLYREAGFAQ